jgi:uncharacterized protein (TIGR03067 family)
MRLRLLSVLAVGLLLGADAPREDSAKKELEKFQGDWVAVSYTVDGKEVGDDELKTIRLTVKGADSTFKRGDKTGHGTYKLGPSKDPKEIDISHDDGPDKGKTALGVYEVEGEKLKICLAAPGVKERPKELASKPGSGHTLEVWKRAK